MWAAGPLLFGSEDDSKADSEMLPEGRSFAPSGSFIFNGRHGWRPFGRLRAGCGLHSYAASRLRSQKTLKRTQNRILLGNGERDVSVFAREQVADGVLVFLFVFVFAASATLAEPALQVLACGGGDPGEEGAGAAWVSGPDHVGVSLQREIGARQHATKSQVGDYGHGFGSLHRK